MNQKIQRSPQNGAPLLSQLAVVDALLDNKKAAVSEAKRAVELLPISKDALQGPRILINLAVVYAWTNELDLAFAILDSLTKTPLGIYYGELKLNPIWDPLRKDPRYEKLLAELAPRDLRGCSINVYRSVRWSKSGERIAERSIHEGRPFQQGE